MQEVKSIIYRHLELVEMGSIEKEMVLVLLVHTSAFKIHPFVIVSLQNNPYTDTDMAGFISISYCIVKYHLHLCSYS